MPDHAGALILGVPASRTVRNKLLFFRSCLVCGILSSLVFCYNSLNRLKTHYQLFLLWLLSDNDLITLILHLSFCCKELSLLLHLFIYPFIYIRMDSWILTLFNELKCISIIVYFDAHIVPDWASGGPFKLTAVKDSS